jgi:hypothetical protein
VPAGSFGTWRTHGRVRPAIARNASAAAIPSAAAARAWRRAADATSSMSGVPRNPAGQYTNQAIA